MDRAYSAQELLEGYVKANLSVIGEFSSNMQRDWLALFTEAESYCKWLGLDASFLEQERWRIEL